VVFCSSMVQYLRVPGLERVPAVVDLVDVDSQKWFDYAEGSHGLKRWLFRLEGRRLRRLEASLPRGATAVTLVSRHEADLYRGFCPADGVRAIPNGVDLEYFRPGEPAEKAELAAARCVFVGALDYRANLDGVRWFCEQVWPEVRRRRPGATFAVVGSNPGAAARRLAERPGVELVGEVPDVRPHLAGAAVVVVPLRVARGIQNKVLEALAMGKAVVATPQALEGLGVEAGVHVCRAAGAGQWIEAVTSLLDDRQAAQRLGRAGRGYVEAHHRWDVQLRPFGELLGLEDSSQDG
jgi:sugar transferase (PEP-CTERM/EpsH1 system associated)